MQIRAISVRNRQNSPIPLCLVQGTYSRDKLADGASDADTKEFCQKAQKAFSTIIMAIVLHVVFFLQTLFIMCFGDITADGPVASAFLSLVRQWTARVNRLVTVPQQVTLSFSEGCDKKKVQLFNLVLCSMTCMVQPDGYIEAGKLQIEEVKQVLEQSIQ